MTPPPPLTPPRSSTGPSAITPGTPPSRYRPTLSVRPSARGAPTRRARLELGPWRTRAYHAPRNPRRRAHPRLGLRDAEHARHFFDTRDATARGGPRHRGHRGGTA